MNMLTTSSPATVSRSARRRPAMSAGALAIGP
jgi:hypothetical protein